MRCEYSNATERGLNQHFRMKHKISQIDGLEDSLQEATMYPEAQEKLSQTEKVNAKEAEVQTEPSTAH